MVRMLNFPEMPPPPEEGDGNSKKEEDASIAEEEIIDINEFRKDDKKPVDGKYLTEFATGFTEILSGIPREIEKLVYQLPAQRQQRLLAQNQDIVSQYDDETLLAWTEKDKSEWPARPVFFYAVFLEARKRGIR